MRVRPAPCRLARGLRPHFCRHLHGEWSRSSFAKLGGSSRWHVVVPWRGGPQRNGVLFRRCLAKVQEKAPGHEGRPPRAQGIHCRGSYVPTFPEFPLDTDHIARKSCQTITSPRWGHSSPFQCEHVPVDMGLCPQTNSQIATWDRVHTDLQVHVAKKKNNLHRKTSTHGQRAPKNTHRDV